MESTYVYKLLSLQHALPAAITLDRTRRKCLQICRHIHTKCGFSQENYHRDAMTVFCHPK